MAGISPTLQADANSLISQAVGGASLGESGSQIAEGVGLSAAAKGASLIPVVGPLLGSLVGNIASIFTQHAAKVATEKHTLDGAVPAWRSLIVTVANGFNQGQINSTQALGYIEQARQLYYKQVAGIMTTGHGLDQPVPSGGCGLTGKDSYYQPHGRFAPFSPCNGACYIAYYYVEPEAVLMEQAIAGNQQTTVSILDFHVNGGDDEPAIEIPVAPPLLQSILPAGIYNALPQQVRDHPYLYGGLLAGFLFLFFAGGVKVKVG